MTLFKCQKYLARTALIGDTFQIEEKKRKEKKHFRSIAVFRG